MRPASRPTGRADGAADAAKSDAAEGPTRTPMPSRRPTSELIYEVVLSEDQGNFKFGKTELPDEAKRRSTRWSRS